MRRIVLFYAVLVLVAAGGSLVAGELMVRLLAPQDLSGTWLTYGPRGLIVNRKESTARHQQRDMVVQYRFNRFHQRGNAPLPASGGILVLGDSFTFGWLLDAPTTYVGRLQAPVEQRFGAGRYHLQNAATPGWGMGDYLAYLESFGDQLAPTMVVVFVNFDDINRALKYPLYVLTQEGVLEARDLSHEKLLLKQIIDRVPAYSWLLEHSHLVQLMRNAAVRGLPQREVAAGQVAGSAPPPESAAAAAARTVSASRTQPDIRPALARALLGRLKEWTDRRNIPLLVTTTGWFALEGAAWLRYADQALGLNVADLGPQVGPRLAEGRHAYSLPDGHPNARGAALIAEAAWPALEKAVAALPR